MARTLDFTFDGMQWHCEFKEHWFKTMCGQGGVAAMMGEQSAAIAARASSMVPGAGTHLKNPHFMSAVDDNRGWPHGRVWAANPYSIRYQNKHKVLEACL